MQTLDSVTAWTFGVPNVTTSSRKWLTVAGFGLPGTGLATLNTMLLGPNPSLLYLRWLVALQFFISCGLSPSGVHGSAFGPGRAKILFRLI